MFSNFIVLFSRKFTKLKITYGFDLLLGHVIYKYEF